MTDESVTMVEHAARRTELRTRKPPEARKAEIIDAAFTAFAAHGLEDTRLEDVARLAGVAKGTIYLYFPNKEALFREMIQRTIVERLDALEREPRDPVPLADFERVARTFWSYVNEPEFPVLHRLISSVLPRLPELSQFFAERVALRWQRLMQSTIDACVREGLFGAEQAPDAARMLHSLMVQHALMRANATLRTAGRLDDADVVFTRLLSFFRAALRPSPHIAA
jgi:AcrR family transcriptional regulator